MFTSTASIDSTSLFKGRRQYSFWLQIPIQTDSMTEEWKWVFTIIAPSAVFPLRLYIPRQLPKITPNVQSFIFRQAKAVNISKTLFSILQSKANIWSYKQQLTSTTLINITDCYLYFSAANSVYLHCRKFSTSLSFECKTPADKHWLANAWKIIAPIINNEHNKQGIILKV